jgi:hypothetical protein
VTATELVLTYIALFTILLPSIVFAALTIRRKVVVLGASRANQLIRHRFLLSSGSMLTGMVLLFICFQQFVQPPEWARGLIFLAGLIALEVGIGYNYYAWDLWCHGLTAQPPRRPR